MRSLRLYVGLLQAEWSRGWPVRARKAELDCARQGRESGQDGRCASSPATGVERVRLAVGTADQRPSGWPAVTEKRALSPAAQQRCKRKRWVDGRNTELKGRRRNIHPTH
ncbi:hypothetical protein K437DRAFT_6893 [Tilletiaria anomala UBC 951]|uniref:Uncharacterized protein n=1 Tax=Tilletiaria anomala (strain ATCC 24038 / CBS 436.72 / UBC 951) TaxID=1037660 RepID=A0A066WEU7_TILAU|nr:uncharacterized protein K437DRAFT_6893 [Tilletiaria anomala UBC 951]KDN52467.1 hypothetical protein K437DRAFT_6893 [Tilletiaria anomala UBC 951]